MNSLLFKLGLALCLAWPVWAAPVPAGKAGNSDPSENDSKRFVSIVVNGRSLVGPNSSAQQIGGRLLLPVVNVAASLGDTISVDPGAHSISVRRQTGVTADFDARLGQVRENGARILSVSGSAEIVFTGDSSALLLPAEIVSSLLDVAIRFDVDRNAVMITRGGETLGAIGHGRRPFELFQVDYEYDLDRYLLASQQNLTLNALGRIADGRFTFMSSAFVASGRDLSLQTASFRFERANGQRFIGGDQGTGTDLQFLSTALRGASAGIPVSNFVITAFGGRTYSGSLLPPVVAAVVPATAIQPQRPYVARLHFDTNVYGVFATSDSAINGRGNSPWGFSAGGMHFDSATRHGELASGSFTYRQRRLQLQGDIAGGNFTAQRADGSEFSGAGSAIDLAATFQLTDQFAFQARYTNVSKNFLSPQAGMREPVVAKAASMSWSPRKWLSTSFSASSAERSDDSSQKSRSFTAAVAITPRPRLPQFSLSHTQNNSNLIPSSAFTMLTASKEFARLRVYLNATRVKLLGATAMNGQIGANYSINDSNSLEFSQGASDNGAYSGQFDWRGSNLLKGRLDLSAGGGYERGSQAQKLLTFTRLSAGVRLPRQTSLQLNYVRTTEGSTLLLSLRGTLFRKRESQLFLDSPVTEMNSYSKISGRVYQDVDLDGKFDADVDKPQAGVKVRVDGNRYVLSDENGMYSFDAVPTGAHSVFLDLLSVRADLTFLDRDVRDMAVTSERGSISDFRLVRTGRISGRVWMDANENGQVDEGETPLSDVRVVTASGRDTLTDSDGYFAIGDLPPGDHVILIDEKTLPEKMMAELKPVAIRTLPGKETGDVKLPVAMIPAEVKRFGARASK